MTLSKGFISVAVLALGLLCGQHAHAERLALTDTPPVGSEELMSRLVDDAFTEIRLKYNDLQKNFTPHFLTSGLDLDCRTGNLTASDGRTFSGVRYENKVRPVARLKHSPATTETVISVTHLDCYSRIIFVERIRVHAAIAKPMTTADAVKFQRSFLVGADESYRDYAIEDRAGTTLISIRSERKTIAKGFRIRTAVELGRKEWMVLDQAELGSDDRLFSGRFFSGQFPLSSGSATFDLGAPQIEYRQRWTSKKLTHEIDGQTVSQSTYDESIQDLAVQVTGIFVKAAISNFVSKFPETVHVMVGVSDSPFLRELQLNYNRLILKKEEPLVRQFFEKTIQDIKEGRLKVE